MEIQSCVAKDINLAAVHDEQKYLLSHSICVKYNNEGPSGKWAQVTIWP